MITGNVLQRVFQISAGTSAGTCFTIEVDGKQYIISAKHIAEPANAATAVRIFHGGQWKEISLSLAGHCDGEIDISPRSLTNIAIDLTNIAIDLTNIAIDLSNEDIGPAISAIDLSKKGCLCGSGKYAQTAAYEVKKILRHLVKTNKAQPGLENEI